jgi:exoribonuclease R
MRAWFDAIRAEHGVSVDHPRDARAEAIEAARRGPGGVEGERADLRAEPFVTLDPPGSRDLDQAMRLARRGRGYRVEYAIADVAAFVAPGGPLDRAARGRGTTVYCPDTRAPLHPHELGEGAASLLPGEDRAAVVWTIDLDADGEVATAHVRRAWVRSHARLDYPTEQRRLDAGAEPDDPVTLLAEVGRLRHEREAARGGVSLARPEQSVVATADGWGLELRAPLPVEEHNAQVSLLTGTVAATIMLAGGVGVLRTMPPATPEALTRLRAQALALGVGWPAGAAYPDVLDRLDRSAPGAAAFLVQATRLFRGAAWTPFRGTPPAEARHGAVGAPYAHVTAPLRRLVDRFGTETCLALDAGREVPGWVLEALPEVGALQSAAASRAGSVDRACTDLVEAAVLAPRVGEHFEGLVVEDRVVQLTDPAVVARVDGTPPPGRPVTVELLAADPATRAVRFAAVPAGGPSA